jgi:type VI secretion system protein ImpB
MAKEGSVAPKERVNITYKAATGDAQEQKELPLKMLVLGDFTGRPDARPVEERTPINIDKDNFDQVMAEQKLTATVTVPNTLGDDKGAELNATLAIEGLADFTPDGSRGRSATCRHFAARFRRCSGTTRRASA